MLKVIAAALAAYAVDSAPLINVFCTSTMLVSRGEKVNNKLASSITEIAREKTMQRQSSLVKFHASRPLVNNGFFVWVVSRLPYLRPNL